MSRASTECPTPAPQTNGPTVLRDGRTTSAGIEEIESRPAIDRPSSDDSLDDNRIELKNLINSIQLDRSGAGMTIDRYTVIKELGRGGMGITYLATDPNRPMTYVVIKCPLPDLEDKSRIIERFERERVIMGELRTEGRIAQLFESGDTDGRLFLVMQYVEGVPLSEVIRGRRSIDPIEAARHACDAAAALIYAHGKGVTHRDIKPSNLIRDKDGRVWVIDFGLAVRSEHVGDDRLTDPGNAPGTRPYMAPERFKGSDDPKVDIFALGCTLYELLTKTTRHHELPPDQMLEARLKELLPDAPTELVRVLRLMLAKDPAGRPNAREAYDELTKIIERSENRQRSRRRLRLSNLVLLLLLAVAFAVAVAGLLRPSADSGQRDRQPVPPPPSAISSVPDGHPVSAIPRDLLREKRDKLNRDMRKALKQEIEKILKDYDATRSISDGARKIKVSDTFTCTKDKDVKVLNLNKIFNDTKSFVFADSGELQLAHIDRQGTMKVVGFTRNEKQTLVEYVHPVGKKASGDQTPSGVLFFVDSAQLFMQVPIK